MTATPHVRRRPLERDDLDRMNLPEDYWRVRLQGLPEKAGAIVHGYVTRFHTFFPLGAGMLLSGLPGVGKTALASVLAREARMAGYSVYFTSVWDLRDAVRARTPFDGEQSVVERCRTADLLVLDNLRTEDGTDAFFGRRALEELLAGRAAHHRVSVVTTRIPFPTLDSPAAGGWRGFLQAGKLAFVPVEGPDLRAEAHRTLADSILHPPTPDPGAPR